MGTLIDDIARLAAGEGPYTADRQTRRRFLRRSAKVAATAAGMVALGGASVKRASAACSINDATPINSNTVVTANLNCRTNPCLSAAIVTQYPCNTTVNRTAYTGQGDQVCNTDCSPTQCRYRWYYTASNCWISSAYTTTGLAGSNCPLPPQNCSLLRGGGGAVG